MTARRIYRPPVGEPDDGTNGHLGMEFTKDGEGPADGHEAHYSACWCGDLTCTLWYGTVCDTGRGRYIHVPPGLPHRRCILR